VGRTIARLADRELDITLAPAGVLDVEVIDESGAPLRDVRVSVTSARSFDPGVPSFAALGDGDGYGPTDLQGRAHIGMLPCGVELRVESRPSRTRRIATSAATTTIEPERRHAAVQLVVASAGALAGTVRPGPAEGERIEARFRTRSTTKPVSALVQPDGRFLLERVPAVPGRLEIDVIRIGTRATTEVAVERDVAIVPGELTDTGILKRAASARLAGHVRDWQAASSDDFVDLRFLRDGRTLARTVLDDEGRFEALLPPGPCALEVVHFGAVLGVVPCSAPDDDLELDLLAFCAGLRGRVPESERELPMFFPHVASGDSADPAQRIAPLPTHGPMRLRAGEFRTLTLAPGQYSLLAPFGERGSAWIPRVVLERGRVADLGQLVAGFGALRGRVVDEHGEPVPGAEIRVSSSYASVLRTFVERSATSGADGAFEVRGLSAGPWIASARSAGSIGTSEVASVFPDGNTEVEIVLQRSAQLSVRASNGGEPGANEALVLERDGGPERVEGRTSDDGRLELDGLAPGEWRWSLGAAPVRRSGRIELHAGERRALAIEERAHPVRLRFVDAPGEIVEALAWTLDAGEMRRSTRIFADGFELDLEPGRHVIAARTSDAGVLQARVGLVEVPTDARQARLRSFTARAHRPRRPGRARRDRAVRVRARRRRRFRRRLGHSGAARTGARWLALRHRASRRDAAAHRRRSGPGPRRARGPRARRARPRARLALTSLWDSGGSPMHVPRTDGEPRRHPVPARALRSRAPVVRRDLRRRPSHPAGRVFLGRSRGGLGGRRGRSVRAHRRLAPLEAAHALDVRPRRARAAPHGAVGRRFGDGARTASDRGAARRALRALRRRVRLRRVQPVPRRTRQRGLAPRQDPEGHRRAGHRARVAR
jgi:hypothetical protein